MAPSAKTGFLSVGFRIENGDVLLLDVPGATVRGIVTGLLRIASRFEQLPELVSAEILYMHGGTGIVLDLGDFVVPLRVSLRAIQALRSILGELD
jgi:hypothetical protein